MSDKNKEKKLSDPPPMFGFGSFGGGFGGAFSGSAANAAASAQSFNSGHMFLNARPVAKPVHKEPPVPLKVRKSFPESWIFDNLQEIRY